MEKADVISGMTGPGCPENGRYSLSHKYFNELTKKKKAADELCAALVAMLERNEPMMTARLLVENGPVQKEIDAKRAENKVLIDACRTAIKSYRESV